MQTTAKTIKNWFISKRKQERRNIINERNASTNKANNNEHEIRGNFQIQRNVSFMRIGDLCCPVLISPIKTNPFINIGYVFIPI